MDKIIVRGGKRLQGSVQNSGAKNSALPLLFSALLCEGTHIFHNVPDLKDIESTCFLLDQLGCSTRREGHSLFVTVNASKNVEAHYDIVRKMRASILCLGPLLARFGEAHV